VSGTQGLSVVELMKRAGLTHGGFYAHFASRDDLVTHAIDRMFQDSAKMLLRHLGEKPDGAGLSRLIDHYLSEKALRMTESGCPLPGLTGEAGRMPPAARDRFEAGIVAFREGIREALDAMGQADAENLAGSLLAEMVGAITLARSMSDQATALSFLAGSRSRLKERAGVAQS
jgi:TetR/AcrR family transcriptional repressor of nem operon